MPTPVADITTEDLADFNGANAVDVSASFADPDGDPLTFSATGLPPGLSISTSGVISGGLGRSASQGGPATNGIYTVVITADDGSPGPGNTITDTITITVTNPPPVAMDDNFTTTEDNPVSGDVSGNDSDPDGDPLDYALDSAPTSGAVTVNSDGTFTYTPNADFAGTDSFSYSVTDNEGGNTPPRQ